MTISRVEIVTSMSKLEDLRIELSKVGVTGMTVLQALGCGVQKGAMEFATQENKIMELLPKQMIILYVPSDIVPKIEDVVKKCLYTGHIGDGKIFVSDVTDVIRVRTGAQGIEALDNEV